MKKNYENTSKFLINTSGPLEIPGVIVVHYRRDIDIKDPNYFSFGGAPGVIDENGNWEQLGILINIDDKNIYKTLDYNN
ncbi:MAG: hypothetical protein PHE25_05925 [Candidatus Gracilibacteria bacterium]|nr:hypothetical protein [Candidatus Gracilibacteria bacterium]